MLVRYCIRDSALFLGDAEADSEGVIVPPGWRLLNWQEQHRWRKVSEMKRNMLLGSGKYGALPAGCSWQSLFLSTVTLAETTYKPRTR